MSTAAFISSGTFSSVNVPNPSAGISMPLFNFSMGISFVILFDEVVTLCNELGCDGIGYDIRLHMLCSS